MVKRPKLNDRQLFEKDIRDNAAYFTLSLFVPGSGFTRDERPTKEEILTAATELWARSPKTRPILIYAIRADGRFTTIGQHDRNGYREFPI